MMPDPNPVEIRSSRGSRILRFEKVDADFFEASLRGDGIEGRKKIDNYLGASQFVELFDSIARDWRGWDGNRQAASLESDLKITASTTKLGQITLLVRLRHCDGVDD